jgi:hypothetical protein
MLRKSFVVVATLTLFVSAFSACCLRRSVATEAPKAGCLKAAPPTLNEVQLDGPDAGCPVQFLYCVDLVNGLKVHDNYGKLKRYSEEAYIRCGPVTDGGSP